MNTLEFDNEGYKNKFNEILKSNNFEDLQKHVESELKKRNKLIKKADEAFLNSILSFAVYEENSWMFNKLNSDLSEMGSIFGNAIKNKDKMYDLKIWHFMKNTFEKIPDHELNIPSEHNLKNRYNYQTHSNFKDGQYSAANGLAHASILKSKHPKGDILHLTFRGTEFSRLFEYIKGPYLDMSAYYEHFRALEMAIKDYVNNPNNNIKEIHVSGHSLGGAMVQEFLKNNPPENFNVPIKGFTFGSPGSEKKWYHKFATIAYHTLGRRISINNMYFSKNNSNNSDYNPLGDERITQYSHNNDPVPLVGLLGYMKGGNNYSLPDVSYKKDKDAKLEKKLFLEKIPTFGKMMTLFKENILNKFNTKFHDSKRYIINIRSYIDDNYKDPHFGVANSIFNTPNWQNWKKNEKSFGTLSIKYKSAFEFLIREQNPQLDDDNINKEILEIRERMKCDSKSDVILSKTQHLNSVYDNTYKMKVVMNDDGDLTHNGLVVKTKDSMLKRTMNVLSVDDKINQEQPTILNSDKCSERIQRMRKSYEDKMEARAVLFKKSN